MEQTYLLTGATGFLGRSVVQFLLAHGCRVAALVTEKIRSATHCRKKWSGIAEI